MKAGKHMAMYVMATAQWHFSDKQWLFSVHSCIDSTGILQIAVYSTNNY